MYRTDNIIDIHIYLLSAMFGGICALHQIADIPKIIKRRTPIIEIDGGAGRSLRSEPLQACGWQFVKPTTTHTGYIKYHWQREYRTWM